MIKIKMKTSLGVRTADVYKDDIHAIRVNFGRLEANIFPYGIVKIYSINDIKINRFWMRSHTLDQFTEMIFSDPDLRYKRPLQEISDVAKKAMPWFDQHYTDQKERAKPRRIFFDVIRQTNKYDNPEDFKIYYENQLSKKSYDQLVTDLEYGRLD